MTASQLFSGFSLLAMVGWVLLAAGVIFNKPFLRDRLAGIWIPVLLSTAYCALMVFFLGGAKGGFDSLENVMLLFTNPWLTLGGWIHYLAFDLFIGAYIARESVRLSLSRWTPLILLPLTFLFGPAGFLCFQIIKTLHLASNSKEKSHD